MISVEKNSVLLVLRLKAQGSFLTPFVLSHLASNPSYWFYIQNISRVCSPLPTSAATSQLHATLTPHLDFYSSLLSGLPVVSALSRAARVNVLKYKSYHVIPLFKNPCNGFSFYSVKKPKSLQGLCDLDSYFLLTSSLRSLPHPLSDHTGPLIPQTSQAFASSLYLTSTRLTPLLPSGPVWLSHHLLRPTLAILFHTSSCLLTSHLHS